MAARGESDAITRAGIGRPAISGGGLEFDGAREAELTEGAHMGMPGEGGYHLTTEKRGAFGDLTRGQHRLELAEGSPGDGAAKRIAREGMAVEERLPFGERAEERFVDLFRRQRSSQRQVAGGEAFREAEEIGDDTLSSLPTANR